MPKYVLKEHVEKGLVDPTKSLDEQREYKEQLQKEAEEKKKNRPQQSEQNKPNHNQKKEKNHHNYKPKQQYIKVTIDTKVPERPKKILEKPNQQKFKETLENLKEQKRKIIDLKKKLIDQQNTLIRETTNNKKAGSIAVNLFSGAMKEKFNIENILRKEISTLSKKRTEIYKQIDGYKQKMNSLKRPQNSQFDSLQNLKQKIQQKEHRLITAKLDKKQQAKLSNQIQTLKRALHKAKPRIEIETEINKSKDHLDILYTQVKNLKEEIDQKRKQADSIKAQVDQLKQEKKNQTGHIIELKKPEQIREEYDQKIKETNKKIQQINVKMDELHKKFYKQQDQYYEQQSLLKEIDYIQKEVAYLKRQKEEAEKRKQQKEQYERKKKKQFEEKEKRREEKKKQEEERKQKQQERAARLQKQRQKYINRNPHYAEIQLAHFLVQYCESLKPSNNLTKNQENTKKQTIQFNKEWQKQIKKGALLIVSKKSMAEQQNKKKVQKSKKREEKLEDQTFTHNIDTVNRFQLLNVLVPKNLAEVDQTIKLLQDKIEFYNNPSAEQVEKFKLKAAKQFDLEHGLLKQKGYKEKQQGTAHQHNQQKDHKHKKDKKKFTQNDFPQI